MEALTTQVAFEKRLKRNEGVRNVNIREKNVPGQGKSKCKHPVARRCSAFKEQLNQCCWNRAKRESMAEEEIMKLRNGACGQLSEVG